MPSLDELMKNLDEHQRDDLAKRVLMDVIRKQSRPVYQQVGKTVEVLRERYDALADKNDFNEGEFVCWKPGLMNRRRPAEGEPAIVVKVLEEPVYDEEKDAGSPTFREPLDLVLGLIDEDEDFLTFHFDSRRFHVFEEQPNLDQSGGA